MKRTSQATVALFAIGVAAQSPTGIILGSTTRVTNPSDTGVVTVSYPICPSSALATVTKPMSTYTGGPLNQYGHNGETQPFVTTLTLPCPSATDEAGWLTPTVTTIIESCPCMDATASRAPDYVPAGMTTSIATCTVCGESSPTATCLVPTAGASGASPAGASGASPAGTGAGSGTTGSAGNGSGSPGSGTPGSGSGSSGSGAPGSGTPGSSGSGSSGSGPGAPGSGSPGSGSPGAGSPAGSGSPGAGSPAGSAAAGAGTNPSASLLAESQNAPYGSNSTMPTSGPGAAAGAGSSAGSAAVPVSSFSGAVKVDALGTFLLAVAGSIGLIAWQL